MPVFRIHRMKDAPRQQFRWAPHVSGAANAKPKDYDPADEVEAENEYAAWAVLRGSERPLGVGDILETPSGQLRICKYVGFEEARWVIPDPPPAHIPQPAAEAPRQSAEARLRRFWPAHGRRPEKFFMMMRASRLGDDIDDFCVKCKRVMNHAVVSLLNDQPAKVRCRTCHSDHDFRHEQPPPPKVDPRKAALFNQVLGNVTGLPAETAAAAGAVPSDGAEPADDEPPATEAAAVKAKGRKKAEA